MSFKAPEQPYQLDAEAWGKQCLEIIKQRKPKIWRGIFADQDAESAYLAWASQWAFHWAAKASA